MSASAPLASRKCKTTSQKPVRHGTLEYYSLAPAEPQVNNTNIPQLHGCTPILWLSPKSSKAAAAPHQNSLARLSLQMKASQACITCTHHCKQNNKHRVWHLTAAASSQAADRPPQPAYSTTKHSKPNVTPPDQREKDTRSSHAVPVPPHLLTTTGKLRQPAWASPTPSK
jgi:hypothetical protein